jgi:hypothetical protein
LRESDEFGVLGFLQPAAAGNELGTKVAEVRDRTAEASAAEPQEDEKNLQWFCR